MSDTQTIARCPRILSSRLSVVEKFANGYAARYRDLTFYCTERRELDRQFWLHSSVSRRDRRMPTWADLLTLKAMTIGYRRTAMHLYVPDDQHIDVPTMPGRASCPLEILHLWSPPENQHYIPDFGNFIWECESVVRSEEHRLHYWLSHPVREFGSWTPAWRKLIISRADGGAVGYDDVKQGKRLALGPDALAAQIFRDSRQGRVEQQLKRIKKHISLYTPDENPFPDFRRGLGEI